jgi:hypothetical protein
VCALCAAARSVKPTNLGVTQPLWFLVVAVAADATVTAAANAAATSMATTNRARVTIVTEQRIGM